jgi:hypothetical protein
MTSTAATTASNESATPLASSTNFNS